MTSKIFLTIAAVIGTPIFLFLCSKWFFAGYFKAKKRYETESNKNKKPYESIEP